MSEISLDACKLCGWTAEFGEVTDEGHPDFGGHYIACTNAMCQCCVGLRYAGGDDPRPLLAEQWNRRPTPSSLVDDEDERGFTPSDYADTLEDLQSNEEALVKATLSNRWNVILGALIRCSERGSDDAEFGMKS